MHFVFSIFQDGDRIDRFVSCLHMALPFFLRGASSSKFINYLNKQIVPIFDKVEPNAQRIEEHHRKYERLRKERELRKIKHKRQRLRVEAQSSYGKGKKMKEPSETKTSASFSIFRVDPEAVSVLKDGLKWCGPYRYISPVYTSLASQHPKVVFLKADIDEVAEVAVRWNVSSFSTFYFIKDGKQKDSISSKQEGVFVTTSGYLAFQIKKDTLLSIGYKSKEFELPKDLDLLVETEDNVFLVNIQLQEDSNSSLPGIVNNSRRIQNDRKKKPRGGQVQEASSLEDRTNSKKRLAERLIDEDWSTVEPIKKRTLSSMSLGSNCNFDSAVMTGSQSRLSP
ncbi:hypothetical protein ACH5RR_014836 [Cinchona calisaya]|uniref:Thioredoxin domain-containing protein n=1 Tax=Cinchona calisaya TaxID=153742 RepID=A0ABD2ZV02_9GENT